MFDILFSSLNFRLQPIPAYIMKKLIYTELLFSVWPQ